MLESPFRLVTILIARLSLQSPNFDNKRAKDCQCLAISKILQYGLCVRMARRHGEQRQEPALDEFKQEGQRTVNRFGCISGRMTRARGLLTSDGG